jgi:hypothetical protein
MNVDKKQLIELLEMRIQDIKNELRKAQNQLEQLKGTR